jgi:hypothetical protein
MLKHLSNLFSQRNEYIDKYLFPFEKEELENIGTQYFELIISIGKFLTDKSYMSSIAIPADIKYCALDFKYDVDDEVTSEGEFEILEKMNTELDAILPHTQIEYLYCGFQLKNIAAYTNLKTLILEHCDIYYPLNDLPASLIRLEIFVLEFESELDNLPPNLKVLRIDTGGIGDMCSGYPHPLNNLPSGLEILYFPETVAMGWEDYPANFDNLPSLLKYIYLPPYLAESTNFDTIPDSVEVIEFHHYPKFVEEINKYPASLKKIYTNCNLYKNYEPFDEDIELIKNCLMKNQYFGKFEIYTNIVSYDKFDFYLNKAVPDTKQYKLVFEPSQ